MASTPGPRSVPCGDASDVDAGKFTIAVASLLLLLDLELLFELRDAASLPTQFSLAPAAYVLLPSYSRLLEVYFEMKPT